MELTQKVKDKVKALDLRNAKAKAITTGAGLSGLATSGVAQTFNYEGMSNLSSFISDMVTLIPDLIPLVIVLVIIGVVTYFGEFIQNMLEGVTKKL